jgi:hypothetical protein
MAISSTSNYGTTQHGALASAVASPAGTVVVAYPTGTVQADYTSTNAGLTSDNMALIDGVKYTGGTLLGFAYGASNITVTNSTGVTWPAGAIAWFGFPKKDPVMLYNGPKAVV